MSWWLLLLIAAGLFSLASLRHMWRELRPGVVVGILALRLVGLGAVAGLVLLILHGRERREHQPELPPEQPADLVVLADHSASMDLILGDGAPRRARLERLRQRLHGRLAEADLWQLDWRAIEPADPDRTSVVDALAAAVEGEHTRAVLLASDGNISDLALPYGLERAIVQRGIRVGAVNVAAEGERELDCRVDSIQLTERNPRHATVALDWQMATDQGGRLRWSIDDRVVDEQPVGPADERAVFELPEVDEGWHILEAAFIGDDHPWVSSHNDRRLARFVKVPPQKITLVIDKPRRDNVFLTRTLEEAYGELLDVISVYDLTTGSYPWEQSRLVLLSEVDPKRLPAAIWRVLAERQRSVLVVPGSYMFQWVINGKVPMPSRVSDTKAFDGAVIEAIHGRRPWSDQAFDELKVWRAEAFDANARSTLLMADRLPIMVVDDRDHPRVVLCGLDQTWRWFQHEDEAVRRAAWYFWRDLVGWLYSRNEEHHRLRVTWRQDAAVATGRVTSEAEAWRPPVAECQLLIDDDPRVLAWDGEGYSLQHRIDSSPSWWWSQAEAEVAGERWTSPREPVIAEHVPAELDQTRCRLAPLASLFGDASVAWFDQQDPLITTLLQRRPVDIPPVLIEERLTGRELWLAALILLVLVGEWAVERWAQSLREPA